MAQRLSSTPSGPFRYLGSWLLLAIFWWWAGHNWMALLCLVPLALRAPSGRWYSVTLTADSLRLRRWFTPPVSYPLADFQELAATDNSGRPVRISFADGRSYLFQPLLKQSAWDLRYVPVAGFVEYWTERLHAPAEFAGQVWPDDVL